MSAGADAAGDARLATAAGSHAIDQVKAAIGVLQMVLFAAGTPGIVAAAGLSLLEMIFGAFFGKADDKPLDLPKVINDLIIQDLANDHVRTNLATIIGYAAWLGDQNTAAMTGGLSEKDAKRYADTLGMLRRYVEEACGPSSPLCLAISNLQNADYESDPPYKVLGLPAFLFGASLHLTFLRARFLFSSDTHKTGDDPQAMEMVNVAKRYLAYLDEVKAMIDAAFPDRLGGIGEVVHARMSDSYAFWIADANCAKWPPQPAIPDPFYEMFTYPPTTIYLDEVGPGPLGINFDIDPAPHAERARAWRAHYLADLTGKLEQRWATADRRRDLAEIQDMLRQVVTTYGAA